MFTKEYEIFEFDIAHIASHAEMAMLTAPRPFMVERGHADGVGIDEWVAYEYARWRVTTSARGSETELRLRILKAHTGSTDPTPSNFSSDT